MTRQSSGSPPLLKLETQKRSGLIVTLPSLVSHFPFAYCVLKWLGRDAMEVSATSMSLTPVHSAEQSTLFNLWAIKQGKTDAAEAGLWGDISKTWATGCPRLGLFQSPSEQCDSCLFVLLTCSTTSVTAMPVSNAKLPEHISNKLLHPSKATGLGQEALALVTCSHRMGQT